MNLIENHQLVLVIRQITGRAGEFDPILLVLKIEVNSWLLLADFQGQSGLSHLARA